MEREINVLEDVVTRADLDKRVAERTGFDIELVRKGSEYIKKRLIELMEDPEITTIKMSSLGYMKVSEPYLKFKIKNRIKDKDKLNLLKQKLAFIEELKADKVIPDLEIERSSRVPRNIRRGYRSWLSYKKHEDLQNNARKIFQ